MQTELYKNILLLLMFSQSKNKPVIYLFLIIMVSYITVKCYFNYML